MSEYVTRDEYNGLGRRLAEVEKLEPKVTRNSEDIQKIFDGLAAIPGQLQSVLNKVLLSMGTAIILMLIKDFLINK